ncbi:hypothetical protein AB0L06_32500 [Spirillospora sp. NPDC052269]
MSMRTRVTRTQGAMLLLGLGGALLAAAPAAGATDDPAVPGPPHLISAVVTGCHAPCPLGTSGQVAVTFKQPTVPDGQWASTTVSFNGEPQQWIAETLSSVPTKTYWFTICAGPRDPSVECLYPTRINAIRGTETITATSVAVIPGKDPNIDPPLVSGPSVPSDPIVPTQG